MEKNHISTGFSSNFKMLVIHSTSRERHKSAAYLRLRNSQRTSNCQVFLTLQVFSTEKPKKFDRIGALKGGSFRIFNSHRCKEHLKIEGGLLGKFF